MIVPARIAPPVALLIALITVTILYNAGIAAAPRDFFGEREDLVLLLPSTGAVTSTGSIPEDLAYVLGTRDDVTASSPEIVVLTSWSGHSAFIRGVDARSFLSIEQGTLLRGAFPAGLTDALAGRDFARRFGVELGDAIVLPGSLSESAARVRVVGIFDAPGLPRDELLVSVPIARGLAGLPPGGVHLIRVQTSDPFNITRLAGSIGPTFTYADVHLSSRDVIAGQPVMLTANLTNWGIVGGSKAVVARVENATVGSTHVYVPARSTVTVEIPIHLETPGNVNVTVNPTFAVVVREPPAQFQELPAAFVVGEQRSVLVTNATGVGSSGVVLVLDGGHATTGEDGRGSVTATVAGRRQLQALVNGSVVASREVLVAPAGYGDQPYTEAIALKITSPLVSMSTPTNVSITLGNAGGAAGAVRANVTVDGDTTAVAEISLRPGESASLQVELPALPEGIHRIAVEGLAGAQVIESFPGDPRLEAALRAREAARANPALAPRVGAAATEYIDRIARNVAIAATALTIAAASLAAIALFAVWSRHLAERAPALGTLKSIGADREQAQWIVTKAAARWSALATIAGMIAGIGLALALDSTGTVRAFGHRVPPALDPWVLTVLALAAFGVNVGLARAISGGLYDRSADELLGRRLLIPSADEAPSLHEALEEAAK